MFLISTTIAGAIATYKFTRTNGQNLQGQRSSASYTDSIGIISEFAKVALISIIVQLETQYFTTNFGKRKQSL